LLDLPDWVELFPAHFEGSCGKGMCGRPSSTIGFERRFNPMLQLTQADFVKLAGEPSPRPLNMTAILATNQGKADYACAALSTSEPIPAVSVHAAPDWVAEHEACVLDVREPWEYAAGHIPQAISIPQADLAVQLDTIPKHRELLVACWSGARSLRSAQFLKAVGFERVTNLEGGTQAWIRAGHAVAREALEPSTT
jgi:rhodanese-related sulfurtransferase